MKKYLNPVLMLQWYEFGLFEYKHVLTKLYFFEVCKMNSGSKNNRTYSFGSMPESLKGLSLMVRVFGS